MITSLEHNALSLSLHSTDTTLQLSVLYCLPLQSTLYRSQTPSQRVELRQSRRRRTIVIGGLQDRICSSEHQIEIHNAVPGSELVLLDECGHFAPLEQPEKVTAALTQWYLND